MVGVATVDALADDVMPNEKSIVNKNIETQLRRFVAKP